MFYKENDKELNKKVKYVFDNDVDHKQSKKISHLCRLITTCVQCLWKILQVEITINVLFFASSFRYK